MRPIGGRVRAVTTLTISTRDGKMAGVRLTEPERRPNFVPAQEMRT